MDTLLQLVQTANAYLSDYILIVMLVGTVLKGITKVLGKQRDAWLGISVEQPCEE